MTVAEVVALLQTLPQHAEFTVMNPYNGEDIWWPSGLDWWADFDGDTHWVTMDLILNHPEESILPEEAPVEGSESFGRWLAAVPPIKDLPDEPPLWRLGLGDIESLRVDPHVYSYLKELEKKRSES